MKKGVRGWIRFGTSYGVRTRAPPGERSLPYVPLEYGAMACPPVQSNKTSAPTMTPLTPTQHKHRHFSLRAKRPPALVPASLTNVMTIEIELIRGNGQDREIITNQPNVLLCFQCRVLSFRIHTACELLTYS